MLEVTVNDWAELVDAIGAVSAHLGNLKLWWRGHSVATWNLVPLIYRRVFSERNLTFRFKNMAKSRYSKCPANSDLPAWLFLMQHYRLPTRLLDWTESPMVAMFFAIEDTKHVNEAGSLWALSPTRLNKNQRGEGAIFSADHPHVVPLIKDAFAPVTEPTGPILSLLTDQTDLRMLVQQSVFTVHGSQTPINQLADAANFVARIVIPEGAKNNFRETVDLLGMNRCALFPDLENLAAFLCERGFVRDA
jgi:hypothetical protein